MPKKIRLALLLFFSVFFAACDGGGLLKVEGTCPDAGADAGVCEPDAGSASGMAMLETAK